MTTDPPLLEPVPVPRCKEVLERELGCARSMAYMLELIHPDRRAAILGYVSMVVGMKDGKGATDG
jgi:hypothetical protein